MLGIELPIEQNTPGSAVIKADKNVGRLAGELGDHDLFGNDDRLVFEPLGSREVQRAAATGGNLVPVRVVHALNEEQPILCRRSFTLVDKRYCNLHRHQRIHLDGLAGNDSGLIKKPAIHRDFLNQRTELFPL